MVWFSDALGATRSTLEGVTLDVAKPIHTGSFAISKSVPNNRTQNRGDISENSSEGWTMLRRKPARGIEKCECPSKYMSSSCQNPGSGFYRWYKVRLTPLISGLWSGIFSYLDVLLYHLFLILKEYYITSEEIIDLVGDSQKCACNERAKQCHPETGECQVPQCFKTWW